MFGFKPIESGGHADQTALCDAAGNWQTGELRGVYQLERPLAPLVAARAEHMTIDLDRIVAMVQVGAAQADFTVVEGVGGWRVPLTESEDVASLVRRLALPVVVVARAGLGTINHSLLTLEAVERDGATLAALVLSQRPDDDSDLTLSNAEQILRRWAGRILVYAGDESVLDPLLERST